MHQAAGTGACHMSALYVLFTPRLGQRDAFSRLRQLMLGKADRFSGGTSTHRRWTFIRLQQNTTPCHHSLESKGRPTAHSPIHLNHDSSIEPEMIPCCAIQGLAPLNLPNYIYVVFPQKRNYGIKHGIPGSPASPNSFIWLRPQQTIKLCPVVMNSC